MNDTPRSERVHIGIFGKRNSGKSSLLNAITSQDVAVVSPVKGTTTDPVYKSMELPIIGPAVFIDTGGIDDDGELGELRVKKTKQILRKTDVAVLVVDGETGDDEYDLALVNLFEEMDINYLTVESKADLRRSDKYKPNKAVNIFMQVSAASGVNIFELRVMISEKGSNPKPKKRLISDLLNPGDVIVLVVPIDSAAPKGRLILPQQQVIREAIESDISCFITSPAELENVLNSLKTTPKMVVTDSQAFSSVAAITPKNVALTSFSILMARYKGVLEGASSAARQIDKLSDKDKVLVCEGCTHHKQCDDIGTVKIPRWVEAKSNSKPEFEFTSGGAFPSDLSSYKLIIHCGGCMLNPKEMQYRHKTAEDEKVPMTNFGIAISYMEGILERCEADLEL